MPKLYMEPECYDFAFNCRDFEREVDFLESIFRKHSDKKITSVLDIGCGTCSHLVELAKRGYDVDGIDNSEKMLLYSEKKFNEHGLKRSLYKKDMRSFTLNNKYDAAITMANTFLCLLSEDEYDSSLNSVASVLKRGGLYVIEFDNPGYWYRNIEKSPSISDLCVEDEKIRVFVKSFGIPLRPKEDIYEFNYIIEIEENGMKRKLESRHTVKLISVEEFQLIIERNINFEFLTCYGDFDFSHFDAEKSLKMIEVLKRI